MRDENMMVTGLFESGDALSTALEALRNHGFLNPQISVLFSQPQDGTLFASGAIGEKVKMNEGNLKEVISATVHAVGFSEFDSDYFALCVSAGKCFLAIDASSHYELELAKKILTESWAQDVVFTKVKKPTEYTLGPRSELRAPDDIHWPL